VATAALKPSAPAAEEGRVALEDILNVAPGDPDMEEVDEAAKEGV